jgi:hypothetical protein
MSRGGEFTGTLLGELDRLANGIDTGAGAFFIDIAGDFPARGT